ncbi:uncharacterized protein AC631_02622 [Debaryomyces fabryi]|uniref:C-CAP/cofactor C-like domain-containing protein n=1 Tax=Debaryomyces fabryi TaxID=58627 RepID=A0A0V1PZD5_9ASCO|nr:uncharacterized protein AC631_02622 [Debaryomyces fabryi]KSA01613.1 hypothetical protein AC631_02622 [Debaryomyces fabryi]CUM47149.1 unnamed protein product [Debaryomyces fabryi]
MHKYPELQRILFSDINFVDLKFEIIEAKDKQELNAIKQKVVHIDQDALGLDNTSYEKRRIKDQVANLHKLVDLKLNSVDVKRFTFRNEPIPNPSPQIVHKHHQQPNSQIAQPNNTLATPLVSGIQGVKYTVNSTNSHLLIADISKSIVITGSTPSSINIHNGSHSILQLNCNGPIFLHDLQHTIIILQCHQLRLHNIVNSTILVDVSNDKIIIENCSNLSVGNHPSLDLTMCRPIQVDDFNQPTARQNSHYSKVDTHADLTWIQGVNDGALQPQVIRLLP